jgi:hypothetical protein
MCPICCKCFRSMLQTFVQNVSSVLRRMMESFFYLDVAYAFTHTLQQYVPNVSVVSILCYSKCFFSCCSCFIWMLHIFHTHVASICPKCLICFKFAFECIMLQVQTVDVGVHEGGQGQAAVIDAWRRRRPLPVVLGGGAGHTVPLWKRRGESSGRPRRDGCHVSVEEAGASHPSNMDSGSKVDGSDASAGKRACTGGARI